VRDTNGRRVLLRLAGALLLVSSGLFTLAAAQTSAPGAGASLIETAGYALLPVALAPVVIHWRRGRLQRPLHAELAQHQADLDAVVLANLELRNAGEADDAARRIARIATELLDAEGAVVWVHGPGRLLCAGGHGSTARLDRELADGSAVHRTLASGTVSAGDGEVVLPLTASGGVFGAVSVHGGRRPVESFVGSVLLVFGAHAGYTLERLRAVETLIDARFVDPVTGVGNRLAATASLATVHAGDAVLLLEVEGLRDLRAIDPSRADLLLGQLGLHVRTATRAGDLVARYGDDTFFLLLRGLDTGSEAIVTRLLESWDHVGSAGALRAGAAIHPVDASPLDTLDRAEAALRATSVKEVIPPVP